VDLRAAQLLFICELMLRSLFFLFHVGTLSTAIQMSPTIVPSLLDM